MSRAGTADPEAIRTRVKRALRRIAFWVVPSAAAFIVLGDVIVAALYETGAFVHADTLLVWFVLAAYTLGLLASTSTRLYINVLYAFQDTRTPALVALVRVLLAAAVGSALMVWLEDWALVAGTLQVVPYEIINTPDGMRPLGAVGLAAGGGLAAWYEWRLLRHKVRQRVGDVGAGRGLLLRLGGAALAGAVLGRAADYVLPALDFVPADLGPGLRAAVVGTLFGAVYLGATKAMGIPEAEAAIRRVTRRLRRG